MKRKTSSARPGRKRKVAPRVESAPLKAAPEETVLVLRTVSAAMRSYGGFVWPSSGPVSAPDWSPEPICGYGLHGLLWGFGDGGLLDWSPEAKWLVVKVAKADVVEIDDQKCKFPRGEVVFCGDRHGAVTFLNATRDDKSRVGVSGTATAGDSGTATAGDSGTATAGDSGTATAGVRGTATAGDSGTATAGVRGTATAGVRGTATAGVRGTATAGVRGTATAGEDGVLTIAWHDERKACYRRSIAQVGENGVKANTPYRLDEKGQFVEVVNPAEAKP